MPFGSRRSLLRICARMFWAADLICGPVVFAQPVNLFVLPEHVQNRRVIAVHVLAYDDFADRALLVQQPSNLSSCSGVSSRAIVAENVVVRQAVFSGA